jgi:hypothetical protein
MPITQTGGLLLMREQQKAGGLQCAYRYDEDTGTNLITGATNTFHIGLLDPRSSSVSDKLLHIAVQDNLDLRCLTKSVKISCTKLCRWTKLSHRRNQRRLLQA